MSSLNVLILDDSITFIDQLIDQLNQTEIKEITTDFSGNCTAALSQLNIKMIN
ncbi:MAG: hypothetical protein HOD92_26565 [Deltaproteobacteria bacterium]|jgi:hypothetical protein|nr:hypothetical protein [Deltaproteobacteria bacterium]